MHRIDHATAVNEQFTEGDTQSGLSATVVTADILNAFQEEIAHVIEGFGVALDKADNAQLWAVLQAKFSTDVPTGLPVPWFIDEIPSGYLACEGAAVSRTTYADLFAVIGTMFGAGDGSTTFNLPDLRGEFLRGWDNSRGVDIGRTLGSLQLDEFENHDHPASATEDTHSHSYDQFQPYINGGQAVDYTNNDGRYVAKTTSSDTHGHTITVNDRGGVETRPRNIAVLWVVKY